MALQRLSAKGRRTYIGWRWWDINKKGMATSVNGIIWPPGDALDAEHVKIFGTCRGPEIGQSVPADNCTCGIWSFYDPIQASALPKNGYFTQAVMFGMIEAWGTIVEHEFGFRAEHAIIRAVVQLPGRTHGLHRAYHDVARYASIDDLLSVWDPGTSSESPEWENEEPLDG